MAPATIYWFTGQPGSGKTTLALAVCARLRAQGRVATHLDGEFMRALTGNVDYSEVGRLRNIRSGQRLAAKLAADGVDVAAAFVSPYRALREEFKREAPVVEIYLHTTAIRGRERFFAANFEAPLETFIDIDTTHAAVDDCVGRILAAVPTRRTGRPCP